MNIEHSVVITDNDGQKYSYTEQQWHIALVYVGSTSKLYTQNEYCSIKVVMVKALRDMFHIGLRDARVLHDAAVMDLENKD